MTYDVEKEERGEELETQNQYIDALEDKRKPSDEGFESDDQEEDFSAEDNVQESKIIESFNYYSK